MSRLGLALTLLALVACASADEFSDFKNWWNGPQTDVDLGVSLAMERAASLYKLSGVSTGSVRRAWNEMRQGGYASEQVLPEIDPYVENFFNCMASLVRVEDFTLSEDGVGSEGNIPPTYMMECLDKSVKCTATSFGFRLTAPSASVVGYTLDDPAAAGPARCVISDSACVPMSAAEKRAHGIDYNMIGAFCGGDVKTFNNMRDLQDYEDSVLAEEANSFSMQASPTGNVKMVVVPAYYAEDAGPCISQAEYVKLYSDIDDWFAANSFNRLQVAITVVAPRKLPKTRAGYGGDVGAVHSDATVGINKADYAFVQVVLPSNSNFGWAGLGSVGGSTTWINGYCTSSFFRMIVEHENGHNLRLLHAGEKTTYDDNYAIMGNRCRAAYCHFQASHKFRLGWTSAYRVGTATAATVQLTSTRNPSPGQRLHGYEFTSGTDRITVEHADFFALQTTSSPPVCVARRRADPISSTTMVVQYMQPNTEYKIDGLALRCSAASGSGMDTSVTLTIGSGAAPSPSSSPAPPPPSPSPSPVPPSPSPSPPPSGPGVVTDLRKVTGGFVFSDINATFYYVWTAPYTGNTSQQGTYILASCSGGMCRADYPSGYQRADTTYWATVIGWKDGRYGSWSASIV